MQKKVNNVLKEQLDRSFDIIKQDNKEELKTNFLKSLSTVLDVAILPSTPLVGVISGNNTDFDGFTEIYIESEVAIREHEESCKKCQKGKYCEEREELTELEQSYVYYTDGEYKIDKKDGVWDIEFIKDTITLKYNIEENTIQVLKSPVTKNCSLCSLCYPNQGDLDTEGSHLTYDLPLELRI